MSWRGSWVGTEWRGRRSFLQFAVEFVVRSLRSGPRKEEQARVRGSRFLRRLSTFEPTWLNFLPHRRLLSQIQQVEKLLRRLEWFPSPR